MVAAVEQVVLAARGQQPVGPAVAAMGKCRQLELQAPRAKAMQEETALAVTSAVEAAAVQVVLEQMPAGQMAAMAAVAFKVTSLVHPPTMQAAVGAARATM